MLTVLTNAIKIPQDGRDNRLGDCVKLQRDFDLVVVLEELFKPIVDES